MKSIELLSHSPEETRDFAKRLAGSLKKGDCLALSGPLGSGKTVFVKGLAEGLGVRGMVKSPTFNLMHIHEGGKMPLYHFDLYRLEASDLEELGFTEYVFGSDGLAVLEWAERVEGGLPTGTIWVHFEQRGELTRHIVVKR